ncbi:hypothetical protein OROMI_022163 [Orobanche minor]
MPFPTMSTEVYSAPRNLKFKITTKGIRSDSEDKSWVNFEKVLEKNGQKVKVTATGNKHSELNVMVRPSMPAKSCKRKPEESLDGHSQKRHKMDRTLKIHCGNILKDLMSHWAAYIFKEPVDPVKLNIPDYSLIITKPMDLGTVKRKLENNMYFCAEEFAADVKLTFSNATKYNPEGHDVHTYAKELNGNFCRRWKLLETKLKQKEKDDEKASFVHDMERNGRITKQTVVNNHQDSKPIGLNKKIFDSSADDKSLWKLGTKVSVMDATRGKVKPARIALKVCSSLRTAPKEPCSRSTHAPAKQSQLVDSAQAKCSSCVSFACHCRLKNGFAQASTSDISSERSSENNQCGDSRLDCEVKHPFHRSSFSQDSDGPGVVMHEEKSPHISAPATTAASDEGWTSLSVQMSPSKALRAAMLKSRFADTIFRATHQVEKSDPLRTQLEKERLEREKQEEKARIEAEIKAAEAASRRKKQDDLKMKRERERAAARLGLEKMERSVEIYETMDIVKDVERLSFNFQKEKILEQLGLFLRDDYFVEEEDEDATSGAEEGEIVS